MLKRIALFVIVGILLAMAVACDKTPDVPDAPTETPTAIATPSAEPTQAVTVEPTPTPTATAEPTTTPTSQQDYITIQGIKYRIDSTKLNLRYKELTDEEID